MEPLSTVTSLPVAMEIIKQMELRGHDWGDDYRVATADAVTQVIETKMRHDVDRYLEEIAERGEYDRRNGCYTRHLLTELGDIELHIPRTRRYSARQIVAAYARRTKSVDRAVLACFVLGCSTRKVAEVLLPILGERISPTTVSRVARILDDAVAAFHRRPLRDEYRALVLDGVVLTRKTGIGSIKRPVLVALGIRPDGRKEVIDYRLARAESQVAWEFFLNSLLRRGLTGDKLEIICVDGGAGLLAALPLVYPDIPVQRCWAHKMRNLTDKVKKKDRDDVKADLRKIYLAKNTKLARKAARRVATIWGERYPKVISSLRADLDALLSFHVFRDKTWRKMTRTTNSIERCFVEVRRRTRPMGVFSDKTSMDRILYAVFTHLNKNQGISTPFLLTQNS